jgi:hypothetical protein
MNKLESALSERDESRCWLQQQSDHIVAVYSR